MPYLELPALYKLRDEIGNQDLTEITQCFMCTSPSGGSSILMAVDDNLKIESGEGQRFEMSVTEQLECV
jgi:hypothetical protein